jgi:hypothetical protein
MLRRSVLALVATWLVTGCPDKAPPPTANTPHEGGRALASSSHPDASTTPPPAPKPPIEGLRNYLGLSPDDKQLAYGHFDAPTGLVVLTTEDDKGIEVQSIPLDGPDAEKKARTYLLESHFQPVVATPPSSLKTTPPVVSQDGDAIKLTLGDHEERRPIHPPTSTTAPTAPTASTSAAPVTTAAANEASNKTQVDVAGYSADGKVMVVRFAYDTAPTEPVVHYLMVSVR